MTPTGSVSFATSGSGSFSGGGSCVTAPTATAGVAACRLSYVPLAVSAGTHAITAGYGGDANHAPSQGTAPLTVVAATTSTAIECRPLSVLVGRTSACKATVTDTRSGGLTPAGSLRFATSASGSFSRKGKCTLAATRSAGVSSCQVTYTPSTVGSGRHTITASYSGEANHLSSHDATLLAVKSHVRPPALSGLKLSPARFRAARRGASITVGTQRPRRRSAGTKMRYLDSAHATTKFIVERAVPGVRVGRRCIARHGKLRRRARRCTRTVVLGSFKHVDKPGANSLHFTGRVRGKALAPGRYTLHATASNGGGVSKRRRVGFVIVR